MSSRLDYCNPLFVLLIDFELKILQDVQNSCCRVVTPPGFPCHPLLKITHQLSGTFCSSKQEIVFLSFFRKHVKRYLFISSFLLSILPSGHTHSSNIANRLTILMINILLTEFPIVRRYSACKAIDKIGEKITKIMNVLLSCFSNYIFSSAKYPQKRPKSTKIHPVHHTSLTYLKGLSYKSLQQGPICELTQTIEASLKNRVPWRQ